MEKPKISFIVCTYNSPNLIANCLKSILKQKNIEKSEIILVDGGSNKKTLDLLKNYKKNKKNIRIINNPKKLPEGYGNGKWLGYSKARGDIISFIDQDNILQREDLAHNAIDLLSKNPKALGILGGLKHDENDKDIVRYVSLVGTDSFFAYRSLDFIRNIYDLRNKDELESINLRKNNMTLSGGNCFFYRKKDLDKIKGYTQDVLVLQKLISENKTKILIIPDATKHYAEKDLSSLIRKKFYWGEEYYKKEKIDGFDYFPKTKKENNSFYRNIIFNILIIPNIIYSIMLYKKSKDFVSFLFPVIALLNTIAYGINFLLSHKQKNLQKYLKV